MIITSLENNKVKDLIKLNMKKYRDLTSTFLVEGEHLVQEAYKSGLLKEIIIEDGFEIDIDCEKLVVNHEIISKISNLDNPPYVIGLCKKKDTSINIGKRILLLDEIQDPGNLGTIIRSAVAFNIDTIILSENCVDLYNPKVIRATQGMIFHTNILSINGMDAVKIIKDNKIPIYGTDVNNGVDARSLSDSDKEKFALVMGNEGNGVRNTIKELCDKNLYINMNNNVESLNVAIATSILLYELGR
ncbi:MAG: RNA methyltransferase [Bacilli bacterium]|nr:RNA methyltransferase [Bacilli bacterium]